MLKIRICFSLTAISCGGTARKCNNDAKLRPCAASFDGARLSWRAARRGAAGA
jgi:hypothetical protein